MLYEVNILILLINEIQIGIFGSKMRYFTN